MSDVLVRFQNLRFDISYGDGDLSTDEGLETAVLLSLFTDRRVLDEELEKGEKDKRGWWGDLISDFSGDLIGSKLWLLDRASASEETRNRAEAYVKEALQWMLDDGVASSVQVLASLVNKSERIDIDVSIQRPAEKNVFFYRFQLVWDGQLLQARKV